MLGVRTPFLFGPPFLDYFEKRPTPPPFYYDPPISGFFSKISNPSTLLRPPPHNLARESNLIKCLIFMNMNPIYIKILCLRVCLFVCVCVC